MSEFVNRADEIWRIQQERQLMDFRNTATAEKYVKNLNYSCIRCGQNEEFIRMLTDGFICEHCLTTKYDLKGTDLQSIKVLTMKWLEMVDDEPERASRIKKKLDRRFAKFFYIMREYGLQLYESPIKHSLFIDTLSKRKCSSCGKMKEDGIRLKQMPICLKCAFLLEGHSKRDFEKMWDTGNDKDMAIKSEEDFRKNRKA